MTAGSDPIPMDERREFDELFAKMVQDRIVYFPVRHHSPACSFHLKRLMRARKPASVLIEGPRGFDALIPDLLHADTVPPVAVYAESRGERSPGAYYPFCEYSPEYVALAEAYAAGASAHFIDLPYGARGEASGKKSDADAVSLLNEWFFAKSAYIRRLCERTGARDQDELWDHLFESSFLGKDTMSFIRELGAYCWLMRRETEESAPEMEGNQAREEYMALRIAHARAGLTKSGGSGCIVVVTGGFHAVRLPDLVSEIDSKGVSVPDETADPGVYLIPYGYDRLDGLNGYGAGMPSPGYYASFWKSLSEAGTDDRDLPLPPSDIAGIYGRTSLDAAADVAGAVRDCDTDTVISVTDVVHAVTAASLLASMRGHPGATREDLADGIRSSFVKGSVDAEGSVILSAMRKTLAGSATGRIRKGTKTLPLVNDFHENAERFKIKAYDPSKKLCVLDVYGNRKHAETSRFFHMLDFLGAGFGRLVKGPDFGNVVDTDLVTETWEYSFGPQVESSLIEASVFGSTIREAALAGIRRVLLETVSSGEGRSVHAVDSMIAACRMGLAEDLPALVEIVVKTLDREGVFAESALALAKLVSIKTAWVLFDGLPAGPVDRMIRSAYGRACFLMNDLAKTGADAACEALDCLSLVRETLLLPDNGGLDPALFSDTCARIWGNPGCEPVVLGGIGGMLRLMGSIPDSELFTAMAGRLAGSVSGAGARVGFIRGLVRTCREIAWQGEGFVARLDEMLSAWDAEFFLSVLPDLRLAFSGLTPRETDKVAERAARLFGAESLGELVHADMGEEEHAANIRLSGEVVKSLKKDGLGGWI